MVGETGREKQIIDERIKKISALRKEGINPYSHKFDLESERVHSSEIKKKFSNLKEEEMSGEIAVVAGRVMVKRSFGNLSFFNLQDLCGTIQIVIQKGKVPEEVIKIFKKIDSGDIVGISGEVMKTRTGEISIMAQKLFILTKAILPLPDKHGGLKNEEEKLRKRYLDIIMNKDVKELFIKKQKFWNSIRTFLIDKGFLEVETPVLENSAGGAAASPFSTHHNALNSDVYLRISMGELWQKKLLVAGYEKTFEIGRQFRNEGMDAEHLQDYTQMEFYWAYADFKDGMKLVEEMYKKIAMATVGSLSFESFGHKIDLGKKWEVYDFEKLIEDKTGVNIYEANKKQIIKNLDELKIEYNPDVDKWRLVDNLWKYCRKDISGPGFLVGQPVELTPLAKRSEKDSRKVEQFQIILGGSEIGNGYSELNDPIDQEERFKIQRELGESGDEEAMEHDEGFIEALKYGMPPACGFGVSERLFSLMANRPIRECVIFPLMKMEDEKKEKIEIGQIKISRPKISRDKAFKLVKKYNKNQSNINHYLESEVIMKFLAEKLSEDKDTWGMLGLLHDLDWELTKNNLTQHTIKTKELLKQEKFKEDFIEVILSHNYGWEGGPLENKKRTQKIEYALACAETVTGLVNAYALMKDKKISDMKLKGLKKKFKDKNFARAIDRKIILECENIGLDIDEFLQLSIDAVKEIKEQVGLT